jgi:precorrin-2 dehydrogenase / sirohydrochlorin ferrochelatase
MIPIVLDAAAVPMALVGRGEIAARRLEGLLAGGATGVAVFSDAPTPRLAALAGERLRIGLPDAGTLTRFRVVWIADLPEPMAASLATAARAAGVLVNVEDVKPWCDFHNVSQVRRGDLLLTVSTGGQSPGLAARIRRHLERSFGPEWAERVERVGAKRLAWRRRRRSLDELARLTEAAIDSKGWLA